MSRELLKQALDALERCTKHADADYDAIAALREALAAPQPEPVGYISKTGHGTYFRETITPELAALEHGGRKMWTPVFAASPAAPIWEQLREIGEANIDGFGGNLDEAFAPAGIVMVPNNDEVICPNCAHQFRAIPVNVQQMLLASGYEPPFLSAAPAPAVPLTDADIDRIADAVPVDQIGIHITTWHRRFARAVLSAAPADCWCETCRPITVDDMRMVVCPTCGNKRCPHATNHRNACTNSNDPGQAGSSYAHVTSAKDAEIARLTACLKRANDQAEHFERQWYLRGDELERAAAVREPLTDEQIDALWRAPMSADWEHREFARAIEAAHGIGGGGNG